jgi:hypothetical protein
MVFYLNNDAILKIRNPGLVDYLDADAMNICRGKICHALTLIAPQAYHLMA